jgi:hypothetical protein
MRYTPTTGTTPDAATGRYGRSQSLSVEDELRDLRIDGYDVVFVQQVALLPAELIEPNRAIGGQEVGRG